jgi:hypothetical protein
MTYCSYGASDPPSSTTIEHPEPNAHETVQEAGSHAPRHTSVIKEFGRYISSGLRLAAAIPGADDECFQFVCTWRRMTSAVCGVLDAGELAAIGYQVQAGCSGWKLPAQVARR